MCYMTPSPLTVTSFVLSVLLKTIATCMNQSACGNFDSYCKMGIGLKQAEGLND